VSDTHLIPLSKPLAGDLARRAYRLAFYSFRVWRFGETGRRWHLPSSVIVHAHKTDCVVSRHSSRVKGIVAYRDFGVRRLTVADAGDSPPAVLAAALKVVSGVADRLKTARR
jgi:hypothetical protein